MPDFSYEALSATGQRSTGSLAANTEREAMMLLDSRGLMPLKISQAKAASAGSKTKVKNKVLTPFYAQLADLLLSGVPLLRSLEVLQRQTSNPAFAEVLADVRTQVADGTSLADAMGRYPRVFNELAVSMISAGQEGGFLEDVLKRIADFNEQQDELKSKVVGAMAYPVFLAIAGFAVLNILVIFFVPQFETLFAKLKEKGELPVLTVYLLALSHFMQSYWWLLFGGLAGAYFAFSRWTSSDAGRRTVDRVKIRLPVGGRIFLNLAIARFTRILGTLLRNGIPILNALKIAKDSTGNRVLADAVEQSAENITAGDKLAKPMQANPYFPRDVVEMVSVAEESNTLDTVLIDIAGGLEKRTARQLELFVRLLEPIMLMVMAVAVLLVVAGLLMPIFKMGSAVN